MKINGNLEIHENLTNLIFSISICLSVDNKGHSEENLSKILDPYMLTSRS